MYDMLTGAPPFTAENRWETHASISSVNTTIDVKTLKEVIFTLSFKKMLPEVPVIFFKNKCEQTKTLFRLRSREPEPKLLGKTPPPPPNIFVSTGSGITAMSVASSIDKL